MAYAHSTTYSSAASGTWVAPQNGQFLVETWGGGGGAGHYGRTTSAHAAGGGGGGAYANTVVTAVSGVGYSYYVAAGGANGANNANGNAGKNTQFNNFQVIAAGGQRGNNTGAAGAGGTVANSAGTNRVAGGAGAANAAMVGGGGGAGGGAGGTGEAASGATGGSGANGGGAGGAGGASNTAGTSGSIPGGAGGAAGGNLGTTFKQSGSGNNGQIIISYNDTIFATITCPATDSALWKAVGQKSGLVSGVASLTGTIHIVPNPISGTINGVASITAPLRYRMQIKGNSYGATCQERIYEPIIAPYDTAWFSCSSGVVREFGFSFQPETSGYMSYLTFSWVGNGSPNFLIDFVLATADANGYPVSDVSTLLTMNASAIGNWWAAPTQLMTTRVLLTASQRYVIYLHYHDIVTHDNSNSFAITAWSPDTSRYATRNVVYNPASAGWSVLSAQDPLMDVRINEPSGTLTAKASITGQSDGVTSESASLNGKVNLSGTIAPLVTATGSDNFDTRMLGYSLFEMINGTLYWQSNGNGIVTDRSGNRVVVFSDYDFACVGGITDCIKGITVGYTLRVVGTSMSVIGVDNYSYISTATSPSNPIYVYQIGGEQVFQITRSSRYSNGDVVKFVIEGTSLKIYCNGVIDTLFGVPDASATGDHGEYTLAATFEVPTGFLPFFSGSLGTEIDAFVLFYKTLTIVTTISGTLIGKQTLNRTGTINGVATLSGTLSAKANRTGTIYGVASLTGTLPGKGFLSGSISGVATPSGIFIATGQKSGQSDVEFITTGVLFGRMKLRGSSRGVARVKLKNHLLFGAAYGVAHLVPYEPLTNKSGTETLVTKSSGEIITTKDGFYGGELGSFMGEIKVQGDGIINGIASLTAGIQAKGNKNGTITGVTSLTGTLLAKANRTGTIYGVASLSGTLLAKANRTGTIYGVASLTGTLLAKANRTGTIYGVASLTAGIQAKGNKNGTITGVTLLTGTLTAKGILSGSINGLSSNSALRTAKGQKSGIISGTASLTGTLLAKGSLATVTNGVALLTGLLTAKGNKSGEINGVALLTGALIGKGLLAGQVNGLTSVTGTLVSPSIIEQRSGTINGGSSLLAILSGRGNKTGLSSGVSFCYAIISGTGALSGNCLSLSSILASLSGRGRLMALTSGQAMTQSNLTMVAVVRLMAGQTEINFVDTGRIKGIGELGGHSDSMSIVMMTILIAYGNLRGINNVQVESFCINVTNDVG